MFLRITIEVNDGSPEPEHAFLDPSFDDDIWKQAEAELATATVDELRETYFSVSDKVSRDAMMILFLAREFERRGEDVVELPKIH